ncbi:glycosyltransferase [Haladaptatus sp. ZSTT2]|uniref:glycosyltransferase n=1 Tax=Haladaptatus sp. ZSTT2 TaxID=3120515 RepID=UPI00300E8EFA
MQYRLPFFQDVSEKYEATFLFPKSGQAEPVEGVNHQLFPTRFGIAFSLLFHLLRTDYDVIVNGEMGGMTGLFQTASIFLIARLRGIPHVMWTERYQPPTINLRFRFLVLLYRVVLPYSAACLVPGVRHKEFAVWCGADDDRVIWMPTVSQLSDNPSAFQRATAPDTGDDSAQTILFVGRLERVKGVEYLVRAVAQLQQSHTISLRIGGTGSDEQRLRELVATCNVDNVSFEGWLSQEDLPSYYKQADVLVLPSVTLDSSFSGGSMGDAFGLVCLEAAAFGTPVIVSDAVGAAHEVVIDGENGYIVEQRNSTQLASALDRILSDSEMAYTMSERSAEIASGFTYQAMETGFNSAIQLAITK